MKSIGFIGQIDNNGFILSVAKLVSAFGNKVIVIDATASQRSRYNTPNMFNVSRIDQTIVLFDSIDVAIGFNNILEIKKYKFQKAKTLMIMIMYLFTQIEKRCVKNSI